MSELEIVNFNEIISIFVHFSPMAHGRHVIFEFQTCNILRLKKLRPYPKSFLDSSKIN